MLPVSCRIPMPFHSTLVSCIIFSLSLSAQTTEPNYSVEYWMNLVAYEEHKEMLDRGIILDSITVAPEYYDSVHQRLNDKGFMAYYEVKEKIYRQTFKDYLYLQHIEWSNFYYSLYFSLAGFDDIEFVILKIPASEWTDQLKISKADLRSESNIEQIIFNYDEGPKNIEDARILVNKDILIMERGHLYHSAYSLTADSVLVNEESPWHASNGKDHEGMNDWIKKNIHDEILKLINE